MQIVEIKSPNDLVGAEETILVLGYFDGIHLGHRALFERARRLADEWGLPVTVLTFPVSPRLAFVRFKPDLLLQLTSTEKRYQLMASHGVDKLYLVDFTSAFAAQSPEEFVDSFIRPLRARKVVAGFDYHFGKNRADVIRLTELLDGQVEVVEEVQYDKEKVSSTRIRQALQHGDVALANRLLGYEFSTSGIVVHGDARGRTIGYPTANIAPTDPVHIPSNGVYVADVEMAGQRYRSMASIGQNITFDGTELRIEAHIFGFSGEIYGERLTIYWLDKIRDMVKFDGIDSLMKQMKQDEQIARAWQSPEKA